jgi:hypothetical protein
MCLNYFCPLIAVRKIIYNFFTACFSLKSLYRMAWHQTGISKRFSHNVLLRVRINVYNESLSSCRHNFPLMKWKGLRILFPLPKLCKMFIHRMRQGLMLKLHKAVSMEKILSSSWYSFDIKTTSYLGGRRTNWPTYLAGNGAY